MLRMLMVKVWNNDREIKKELNVSRPPSVASLDFSDFIHIRWGKKQYLHVNYNPREVNSYVLKLLTAQPKEFHFDSSFINSPKSTLIDNSSGI